MKIAGGQALDGALHHKMTTSQLHLASRRHFNMSSAIMGRHLDSPFSSQYPPKRHHRIN